MYRIFLSLSCFFIALVHAQELRDPTRPIKIEASQTTDNNAFIIKTIIISPTKKTVLVGGRTLTIGDEIMGEKIIDINSNSVKLKTDSGEIIEVSIFDTILKKAKQDSEDKS